MIYYLKISQNKQHASQRIERGWSLGAMRNGISASCKDL